MPVSERGGKTEYADAFAFSFPSHLHTRVFCSLYLIFQLVQRSIQASHSRLSPSAPPLVMESIRKIFLWGEQPAASSASCPLPVLYRRARAPLGMRILITANGRYTLSSSNKVSLTVSSATRCLASYAIPPARPSSPRRPPRETHVYAPYSAGVHRGPAVRSFPSEDDPHRAARHAHSPDAEGLGRRRRRRAIIRGRRARSLRTSLPIRSNRSRRSGTK